MTSTSDTSPTSTTDSDTEPTTMSGTSMSGTTTDTTTGTGSTTATGSTTEACTCTPGEVLGCIDGNTEEVCSDDCMGTEPKTCDPNKSCEDGACNFPVCEPGTTECEGPDAVKTCNDQGDGFGPPVPCADTEECSFGTCTALCTLIEATPTSVGCSFRGHKMENFGSNEPDSFVVGNVHETKTATVQLYQFQNGEQPIGNPVNVAPGGTHIFTMSQNEIGEMSALRAGGSYRVESNIPVVAYQHSPINAEAHNDSSMLLPDHAQKQDYIVAAYTNTLGSGNPVYFNVVALEDDTTVQWTPPVNTAGGNGVPAVNANQTGMVNMQNGDTLQVISTNQDVSGTEINSDKPVWVVGAVVCVNVPPGVTFCDHIEEQMLPLDYWGEEYVGAHAPQRGNEDYYWRIYGGEDGVTVTTNPQQPGTPVTLQQGQFHEFNTKDSFMFTGDGPFLPVQYLEGQNGGAGTGDPASYQMVPVEQFLSRYAFVTGTGYNLHYAQVIRPLGGADVFVDGVMVTGYYTVGAFEVADWSINEGAHLAESADPFGIVQVGYTSVTSYAYPGGMKLEVINPQ